MYFAAQSNVKDNDDDIFFIQQAGITAAPTRALSAVKSMSPNIPNIANNLKNLNLPHIPTFKQS